MQMASSLHEVLLGDFEQAMLDLLCKFLPKFEAIVIVGTDLDTVHAVTHFNWLEHWDWYA